MEAPANRVFWGMVIGAIPGALLWVIGAIVGGEALLTFGVIGMLVGIIGIVIGGVVGGQAERASRSGAGPSKAAIGAMIGCIPGLVLLFFMTRIGIPAILVGGLIGAFLGGRMGTGGPRPTTAH